MKRLSPDAFVALWDQVFELRVSVCAMFGLRLLQMQTRKGL